MKRINLLDMFMAVITIVAAINLTVFMFKHDIVIGQNIVCVGLLYLLGIQQFLRGRKGIEYHGIEKGKAICFWLMILSALSSLIMHFVTLMVIAVIFAIAVLFIAFAQSQRARREKAKDMKPEDYERLGDISK